MNQTGGESTGQAASSDAREDDEESELDLDTTFHLLQNERRRLALRYLLDHEDEGDDVTEMRDIAEQVAAWQHDTTVRQLDSDQRQRVYVGLYQTHLPTLDQHDVIEYDQSRGWVEPTDRCADLEPFLEPAPDANADEEPRPDEFPPPGPDAEGSVAESEPEATDDRGRTRGRNHLLVAAFGLVPLALLASTIGPDVVVSAALLTVMFAATSCLGMGLQRYVNRVTGA